MSRISNRAYEVVPSPSLLPRYYYYYIVVVVVVVVVVIIIVNE